MALREAEDLPQKRTMAWLVCFPCLGLKRLFSGEISAPLYVVRPQQKAPTPNDSSRYLVDRHYYIRFLGFNIPCCQRSPRTQRNQQTQSPQHAESDQSDANLLSAQQPSFRSGDELQSPEGTRSASQPDIKTYEEAMRNVSPSRKHTHRQTPKITFTAPLDEESNSASSFVSACSGSLILDDGSERDKSQGLKPSWLQQAEEQGDIQDIDTMPQRAANSDSIKSKTTTVRTKYWDAVETQDWTNGENFDHIARYLNGERAESGEEEGGGGLAAAARSEDEGLAVAGPGHQDDEVDQDDGDNIRGMQNGQTATAMAKQLFRRLFHW
ncbi:hypothetical protein P154DRAFT_609016 [Amniculicola lignicola CBS 123094]|uniref:Uncharacterized protein n=1 Tax=Amniculicola lignicola CBS 123094 TaxID=1392246 RepID=A0A6A5WFC0_9PLEO|nr:hypothetical protein P154DRAFT_609016 [Amniculicola lignicola CBS 123094]